jgi:tRNA pseudouridine55 synthase
MDGVLLIDKPEGCTSHDVCLRVKRRLRAARIGHTGTLDPLATGVLPLCLGRATKLVQFLLHGEKEYTGQMRLGLETDTQDREGAVLSTCQRLPQSRAAIEAACAGLVGDIEQVPPMYSALKHNGVPLYRLARQGKTVERQGRRVTVAAFEVLAYEAPLASFRVVCSAGTYVRTLCHDAGSRLGCGAVLEALRRVRTGGFHVRDAVSLETIEALKPEEIFGRHVIAMDEALLGMPELEVDEAVAGRLRNGLGITDADMSALELPAAGAGQLVSIRQRGAGLVGVVRRLAPGGDGAAPAWETVRVFAR